MRQSRGCAATLALVCFFGLSLIASAQSQIPSVSSDVVFFEPFAQGVDPFEDGPWVKSVDSKYAGQQLSVSQAPHYEQDVGLMATLPAKHYAVAAPFSKQLEPSDVGLVVQYEVTLTDTLDCGGAYVKVLGTEAASALRELQADTRYVIMFGPDRCGNNDKVHFILQVRSPVSGEWEEKHMTKSPMIKNDRLPHLYTLVLRPDNSFTVKIDNKSVRDGSLLDSSDFSPPVNPPQEIDDPDDEKPDDWVDEARIPDPTAVKPDDWDEDAPATIPDEAAEKPAGWLDDEPLHVPDPEAERPDDWDDEEDGEYEAPMVPNPKCSEAPGCGKWVRPNKPNPKFKGKWSAPMIDNPDYIGEWKPRAIPNPDYYSDESPYASIPALAGVAIEIWTMSKGLLFDNFYVGTDESAASSFADQTWAVKHAAVESNIEAERRMKAKAERDHLWESDQLTDKLQFVLLEGAAIVTENLMAAIVSLVVVTSSLVYFCCLSGSPEADMRASQEPALESASETQPFVGGQQASGNEEEAEDEGSATGELLASEEEEAGDDEEEEDEEDNDNDETAGQVSGSSSRKRIPRA